MHEALLRERSSCGASARGAFGDHCESLLFGVNPGLSQTQASAVWWDHCFGGLPRDVEQLLQQRQQLLKQREAARSAAVTAFATATDPLDAVHQASIAAVIAATAAAANAAAPETQTPKHKQAELNRREHQDRPFFNCLVRATYCLSHS